MSRSEADGRAIRTLRPFFPRLCRLTTSGFTGRSDFALLDGSHTALRHRKLLPATPNSHHSASAQLTKIHYEGGYAFSCQGGRTNQFDPDHFDPHGFGDDIVGRG